MRFLFKPKPYLMDILLCFPSALYLSKSSHEVFIECPDEWRDIFLLISYAKPWASQGEGGFDRIFDVAPLDFGSSNSIINDFVSSSFPELSDTPKESIPVFDRKVAIPDYGLSGEYVLVSPLGEKLATPPFADWLYEICKRRFSSYKTVVCLSYRGSGGEKVPSIKLQNISHLPELISKSSEFVTVNSAAAIIAAAYRKKPFFILMDHGNPGDIDARVNYRSFNAIPIHGAEEYQCNLTIKR